MKEEKIYTIEEIDSLIAITSDVLKVVLLSGLDPIKQQKEVQQLKVKTFNNLIKQTTTKH